MPTEVRGWTCDKCHRRYATRAQAVECESECTQPIVYEQKPEPESKTGIWPMSSQWGPS